MSDRKLSRKFFPKVLFLAASLLLVASLFLAGALPVNAQAVSFNSARNCDGNAVIYCGALNVSELQSKYAADPTIADIFNCFNITSADISSMGTTAQTGVVTRSGDVIVGGKVVAVNAVTAGRQFIAGSTPEQCGNTAFYERPPSVSFLNDQLDAFVVMHDGRFDFAILASCGNPVSAAPTTPATPPPAAPAVQQTPPPSPAPTPVTPKPQPKVLPNTGTMDVVGIFVAISSLAAVGHYLYRKRIYRA